MLSIRWAASIATLETRMRELFLSHRALRSSIDLSGLDETPDGPLSNPMARDTYRAVTATMNQLLDLFERHDALDLETLRPDLVRIYTDLPSVPDSLTHLIRMTDILREAIEIIGLVLDERRRASSDIGKEHASRIHSGVFPKTASQAKGSAQEPRISWSSSPTSYSVISPVTREGNEQGLVDALTAMPAERLERLLHRVRNNRTKRTG